VEPTASKKLYLNSQKSFECRQISHHSKKVFVMNIYHDKSQVY